jgi:hypothetical protein
MFHLQRLEEFIRTPFVLTEFAGAKPPRDWAISIGISDDDLSVFGFTLADLPNKPLTRSRVRRICMNRKRHVMFGYICVMAWGNQGGRGGKANAALAWRCRHDMETRLALLRSDSLSGETAFDLFCGSGKIPGLGPAYFTKLIFYFRRKMDGFICDQWTAKSVNYLVGYRLLKMDGDYLSARNSGKNYVLYCQIIDALRHELHKHDQCLTCEQVEQRLFSVGGHDGVAGPWRKIVRNAHAEPPKPSSSKKDVARAIYKQNSSLARRFILQRFMSDAGLTWDGACTYYYQIKAEMVSI